MPSPRFVDRGAALGETTAGLQLHSGAGDHRGAAAGGTQQPALPGAPLLPPAAASAGRRSDSPWHALEIQSSEDGSGHVHHAKLEAAVLTAAALHTTDPTERLLPGAPSERRPSTPVLPGGISKRERMVMVSLFSLTAALLYAGAQGKGRLGWQGSCRLLAGTVLRAGPPLHRLRLHQPPRPPSPACRSKPDGAQLDSHCHRLVNA